MIQESHSWVCMYVYVCLFVSMYVCVYKTQKDAHIPMFTAALFTIVKTRKQPKCSLTDECIKKDMVHVYDGILLSHKKWNAICSNMDGPRDYHTKWSKSERESYTI